MNPSITKSSSPARRSPPGPRGPWLLGNLPDYRRGRLAFLERLRREFGTMASYRLGPLRLVLVSEPDLIQQILVERNKEFGRSFSTRLLRDFFGDSLLISEGEQWLKDRRLVQPTFAAQQVQAFGGAMVRQTAEYVDSWVPGESRDALGDMQSLTMSIAAETLLGVRLAGEIKAIHEPHTLVRDHLDHRMESLWTLPRWIPTARNRRLAAANRAITGIVDGLIEQRRRQRQFGPDILSRLLVAQDHAELRMTDEQVRNQALTFLFAGHETTASLLGWLWYELDRHPEVTRLLHAELDTVLAGRLPTVDDVPRLPYTHQIVRETLRLYPSVYVMGRRALADCEVGGYHIRRGTNLVLSQWLVHRDPRHFDRPLEFAPDRWTAEFTRQLHHFAWFPFGGGPRVCIGNTFAMLEAVLVVATIASRYRLELLPGQRIAPHASVTLRPSPGVRVVCQPRSPDVCPQNVARQCQLPPAGG